MFGLIGIAVAAVAAFFGYTIARRFVRSKLRYVDASRSRRAPWLAAAGAALLASPFTFLPLIGGGTALLFGASVGLGVAHGARDTRHLGSGQIGT